VKPYIQYTLRTQFAFLQRPLFSVNVGHCPFSSLLISWAGTRLAFRFFFYTSIWNRTCDKLGRHLFLISAFPWTHKHLPSQPWTVEDSTASFGLSIDSSVFPIQLPGIYQSNIKGVKKDARSESVMSKANPPTSPAYYPRAFDFSQGILSGCHNCPTAPRVPAVVTDVVVASLVWGKTIVVIVNGCVLIISRVDYIIVLPTYTLVYLSGRSCTAWGGRWPSTECTCRKSQSQRFRERESESPVTRRSGVLEKTSKSLGAW